VGIAAFAHKLSHIEHQVAENGEHDTEMNFRNLGINACQISVKVGFSLTGDAVEM